MFRPVFAMRPKEEFLFLYRKVLVYIKIKFVFLEEYYKSYLKIVLTTICKNYQQFELSVSYHTQVVIAYKIFFRYIFLYIYFFPIFFFI